MVKRNHFLNLVNLNLPDLSTFDVSVAFDNKLTQNSNIDRQTLFSDEISQMQFLCEYCKLFGLYFDFNKINNTINILTRNEFYSQGKFLDWSHKIDKSKDIELNPIFFEHAYIDYGFKDSESSTPLKNHKSSYGINYGTQRINTGYQFNDDIYTAFNNTIFYPTAMVEIYNLNNKIPVTLPCFSTINNNRRDWSPSSFELLFREGWLNIGEDYLITKIGRASCRERVCQYV